MLVLARKKGESILIGNDIELSVLEIVGDTIKLGIKAPAEVGILRKELYVSVENMNVTAEQSTISASDLQHQFKKIKKS
ncbi:carbon storage regulator, CsrA [Paenibacillus algorifonticola]|uniref:Translational regulator CsrA n=1 Tax=Paenibacillus algorifonticola TaxID=684063 RepID=A0A1I2IYZ9_9BACL|nr:carbon storage regulator CsrA [Paenibacillus algorifonticola]SFF38604.1 carbon storage regulator, CsrA [Paenibacillus algorifonticola]SFF46227.1 carbon storage regulator, CsrA [Paenibacillus algorifonticola]